MLLSYEGGLLGIGARLFSLGGVAVALCLQDSNKITLFLDNYIEARDLVSDICSSEE